MAEVKIDLKSDVKIPIPIKEFKVLFKCSDKDSKELVKIFESDLKITVEPKSKVIIINTIKFYLEAILSIDYSIINSSQISHKDYILNSIDIENVRYHIARLILNHSEGRLINNDKQSMTIADNVRDIIIKSLSNLRGEEIEDNLLETSIGQCVVFLCDVLLLCRSFTIYIDNKTKILAGNLLKSIISVDMSRKSNVEKIIILKNVNM